MDKINQFQILILRDGKLKKIVCVLLHTKNKLQRGTKNYFLTINVAKHSPERRYRKKRTTTTHTPYHTMY